MAHYFGVHQVIEAGQYIAPLDLDESELEFVDPSAPLVEEERPGLNAATQQALHRYLANPTEENKQALLEQMGIKYDKVVARKKAKLRQLEREAHDQYLIDEMQAIVDDYPVVNITYYEAMAYCEWLGTLDAVHAYRLPTENEWIMAAGHMPKDVAMNSNHTHTGLTPVNAYAQTTGACGGIDFWGNCWEWTSTQNASGSHIVKGGAWDSSRDECRTEYSDAVRDPSSGYPYVGFRVVRVDR